MELPVPYHAVGNGAPHADAAGELQRVHQNARDAHMPIAVSRLQSGHAAYVALLTSSCAATPRPAAAAQAAVASWSHSHGVFLASSPLAAAG